MLTNYENFLGKYINDTLLNSANKQTTLESFDKDLRLALRPQMNFSWRDVPVGFDWVAIDADGTVNAFNQKPVAKQGYWSMSDGDICALPSMIHFEHYWHVCLWNRYDE